MSKLRAYNVHLTGVAHPIPVLVAPQESEKAERKLAHNLALTVMRRTTPGFFAFPDYDRGGIERSFQAPRQSVRQGA